MRVETADIRPKSPETLAQFVTLLVKGMLKRLPVKLLIAGGIALLAWILHTYLLVGPNGGFAPGTNAWLDRILALQGRAITGTLVWTLGVGLVTSSIARILAYGFRNTVRSVVDTPKYLWNWANELGILAIPFLFAGFILTIIFGFFFNNALLIVQLILIVMGILIARHTSILITALQLGFSDVQKMARQEMPIQFKLAWPGMYFVGVLVGLVAIIPSGFLAYVCGCLGLLIIIVISAGLFVRSQGGMQRLTGKKIFLWILPPSLLLLFFAVNPAFADDGGWQEAGGTFSGWISSPGAVRAIFMGILPAAGSGLGVLFGTALGSMVSIVGTTGIQADPLSVRPSAPQSPAAKGTPPPPSRTADHQVERFEYQDKGEPGDLSSRHRPDETADSGVGLRSDRAGDDTAAAPAGAEEGFGRSGEGSIETGTGQRDVRGVQSTQTSDTGPGAGSAAETADRVSGFDQQETPAGQMTADRHRPDSPDSGGPVADRHRPGSIGEAGDRPAGIEQPELRAERHTPDSPAGPEAGRHEPGGLSERAEGQAGLEQPSMRAERHSPDMEGGPTASRHDPDATSIEGGGEMRARRAPVDEAGPTASRQPVSEKPEVPIPPAPVPGYALDWELVVVRTPEGSGVEVQQRIELVGHTRIGRHGKIDLKLLDPKVSRQHADIDIEGSNCRIADLDSSNGTFVNGRRITEPTELKHGDAIKIGDTYFVVQQRSG